MYKFISNLLISVHFKESTLVSRFILVSMSRESILVSMFKENPYQCLYFYREATYQYISIFVVNRESVAETLCPWRVYYRCLYVHQVYVIVCMSSIKLYPCLYIHQEPIIVFLCRPVPLCTQNVNISAFMYTQCLY